MAEIRERFPDGTVIDSWFYEDRAPRPEDLGREYRLTDFGIGSNGGVQTAAIQALMSMARPQTISPLMPSRAVTSSAEAASTRRVIRPAT